MKKGEILNFTTTEGLYLPYRVGAKVKSTKRIHTKKYDRPFIARLVGDKIEAVQIQSHEDCNAVTTPVKKLSCPADTLILEKGAYPKVERVPTSELIDGSYYEIIKID